MTTKDIFEWLDVMGRLCHIYDSWQEYPNCEDDSEKEYVVYRIIEDYQSIKDVELVDEVCKDAVLDSITQMMLATDNTGRKALITMIIRRAYYLDKTISSSYNIDFPSFKEAFDSNVEESGLRYDYHTFSYQIPSKLSSYYYFIAKLKFLALDFQIDFNAIMTELKLNNNFLSLNEISDIQKKEQEEADKKSKPFPRLHRVLGVYHLLDMIGCDGGELAKAKLVEAFTGGRIDGDGKGSYSYKNRENLTQPADEALKKIFKEAKIKY